jgi:hypothetical protein
MARAQAANLLPNSQNEPGAVQWYAVFSWLQSAAGFSTFEGSLLRSLLHPRKTGQHHQYCHHLFKSLSTPFDLMLAIQVVGGRIAFIRVRRAICFCNPASFQMTIFILSPDAVHE